MNCPSKRFQYGLANAGDGPEILEILEETDFKGQISLVYTRRLDAFASFEMEGKDTQVTFR